MNARTVLKSLKNEQLTQKEFFCPNCKTSYGRKEDVTFGDCCLAALLNATCQPEDKVKRFKLCQKIEKSNEKLEFTVDERKTLKECIEDFSSVLIAGLLMEILDPNG